MYCTKNTDYIFNKILGFRTNIKIGYLHGIHIIKIQIFDSVKFCWEILSFEEIPLQIIDYIDNIDHKLHGGFGLTTTMLYSSILIYSFGL